MKDKYSKIVDDIERQVLDGLNPYKRPVIKLFVKFAFTSLSPDAQPISMAVVGEDIEKDIEFPTSSKSHIKALSSAMLGHKTYLESKSFYAEFSDFDIDRCDDWVKENIISNLVLTERSDQTMLYGINTWDVKGDTELIKSELNSFLLQFHFANIQFVVDCGGFDWQFFLILASEWETIESSEGFVGNCPTCGQKGISSYKIGLPKLPGNISPVPLDLNDLIAHKKGISVREAFELDRDSFGAMVDVLDQSVSCQNESWEKAGRYNSLLDAKVIKEVYHKIR